jgi:hypothetical protein
MLEYLLSLLLRFCEWLGLAPRDADEPGRPENSRR